LFYLNKTITDIINGGVLFFCVLNKELIKNVFGGIRKKMRYGKK